jgi:hypothetical protein
MSFGTPPRFATGGERGEGSRANGYISPGLVRHAQNSIYFWNAHGRGELHTHDIEFPPGPMPHASRQPLEGSQRTANCRIVIFDKPDVGLLAAVGDLLRIFGIVGVSGAVEEQDSGGDET